MTKVSINDVEYDTENMTDKQLKTVQLLQQNLVSVNMLDHWLQCVKFVGEIKTRELNKSLSDDQEKKEELSRIIENTLEDTSTDLSSLKTSVDNNNRLYEINTYDIKNYEAYNGVMVIVLRSP